MQQSAPTIYLAGPEVFLPDAVAIGQRKKELCAAYGFQGLYPFDNEVAPNASGEPVDARIYRANLQLIQRADLGIVNLTPFRGPSADVGTVFELGFLIGLGKIVFGYTNDPRDLIERVKQFDRTSFDPERELWRDVDGMAIEDFGNADNLMIDQALNEARNPIVRTHNQSSDKYRDLSLFEVCLRMAATKLRIKQAV